MKDRFQTILLGMALLPFLLLGWIVTLIKGEGWEDD